MSNTTTPRHDSVDAKQALTQKARRLSAYLSDKYNIPLKHTHALDVIAHIEGLSNRHVLLQTAQTSELPASDYDHISNVDAVWAADETKDRCRFFPSEFTYWPTFAAELASRIHDVRSAMRAVEIANDFRYHINATRDEYTVLYLDALLHTAVRERVVALKMTLTNFDASAVKAVVVPSSMSYPGAILVLLDMAVKIPMAARIERNAIATLRHDVFNGTFAGLPMPAPKRPHPDVSPLFALQNEESDHTGIESYINMLRLVLAMAKATRDPTPGQEEAIRICVQLIVEFYQMRARVEAESEGNEYADQPSVSTILKRMKKSS